MFARIPVGDWSLRANQLGSTLSPEPSALNPEPEAAVGTCVYGLQEVRCVLMQSYCDRWFDVEVSDFFSPGPQP